MATRKRTSHPGIQSIAIEGYKSLRTRKEIATPPLTVIAGINSSGKSSIMQPLLLLKQTVDAAYDPGPLQLDGPNVSITSVDQILSRGASAASRVTSFSVELCSDGQRTKAKFSRDANGNLRVAEYTALFVAGQSDPVTLREGMTDTALRKLLASELKGSDFPASLLKRKETKLSVVRDRFVLQVGVTLHAGDSSVSIPLTFGGTELSSEVSRIIHLPALRGNPKRTYRTAAIEGRYPGTFDTYTAGIISYWQNNGRTEKLNQLKRDLEELGLTWKVEARQLDDTQVELLVGRLPHARQGGARDLVNIADVGFGVSQTLPVVVALLAADPGQTVYLEQPEIHLHPRAQLHFARLVNRALQRRVRVIIETHSSLLIRAVQTMIARDEMSASDVALHWFTRSLVTGETEIATAELTPDGAFGDWPEDFDDVYLGSEADYLNAAMEKAAKL
ncbi:AAA family ATPase [Streptomyces sp. NPDC101169]|uniref:AAA family ATPase n=1 Tax=Streptomyces sp. NPDC101169 TaxID=3366121 RepID=UPI003820DE8E